MLIAGPCVIEDEATVLETARRLKELCSARGVPLVFKTSYDKANRTAVNAFRGPGLAKGLAVVAAVKAETGLPTLVDVHEPGHAAAAAEVAEILQVPAFLCRQTDLLRAVCATGRAVNVKKGQFLAPWDAKNIVEKCEAFGARQILLTERGSSFGYNNLVSDMRALPLMRGFGWPVVFDATHSVQLPAASAAAPAGSASSSPSSPARRSPPAATRSSSRYTRTRTARAATGRTSSRSPRRGRCSTTASRSTASRRG